MKVRIIVGIVFLLIQVSSIVYARFTPERFFCWAPYDQHTYYEISVEVNNRALSIDEIQDRYGYYAKGWDPRAIDNIFSIISQYESTYGKNDEAVVKVLYSINGHETKLWKP